jgi:ribosomal protein L32
MLSLGRISTRLARPVSRTTISPIVSGASVLSNGFHTSSMTCAVPKNKPSLRVRRIRRNSPLYSAKFHLGHINCSNCKSLVRTHHVCSSCGWKAGAPVTLRAIQTWKNRQARGETGPAYLNKKTNATATKKSKPLVAEPVTTKQN